MEEIVLTFGLYYILFSAILFFLFKKYLYSAFDPMIFIILMMSSCLCLSVDSSFFWYILLGVGSFYLGVISNGKLTRNFSRPISKTNIALLEVFTISVYLLYVFANIMLYKDAGIPLFSDNATHNKIAIFEQGTGWIRRIFFFSGFVPIGLVLLSILSHKKYFYGVLFISYLCISILIGSKSGFLGMFFVIWLFYTQKNLWDSSNISIKHFIKGISKYLVLASLFVFVYVVSKESLSEGNIIYSLGFRLMEFGDVMLYYKTQVVRDYFLHYNVLDFLQSEFNGVLGLFRIVPYKFPLGYEMVKAYWGEAGDVVTGPNGLFLVRGHIFFGYTGGLIYCYLMGFLYSFVRQKILNQGINNIFIYAVSVFIFFNMEGMLREFSQFVTTLFDFVLFTLPLLVLSLMISERIKNKKYSLAK